MDHASTLMKSSSGYLCGTQLWDVSQPRDWSGQMIMQGHSASVRVHTALKTESQQTIPDTSPASDGEPLDPRLGQLRTEAVLLLSKTAVSPRKLAQLAHLADATQARTLVRHLNKLYEDHGRAIRIEQVAGGYRMFTHASLSPWLTRLGHLPTTVRISTPMMETLAVVAYQQPVSRANAEAVRGVGCGEILRQLMERELVRIVGRSEELGRPYLYGTTKRFLQLFGLRSVDALPPIDIEALADDPINRSLNEDPSTSTKELVVSNSVASVLEETDIAVVDQTEDSHPTSSHANTGVEPISQIEDEENEYYNDDDDDEEDDNWSGNDDDEWDDDELDDADDDELDAEDNEWEEVDDEDGDDEDWGEDDDEWDEDQDDDDEEEDWD